MLSHVATICEQAEKSYPPHPEPEYEAKKLLFHTELHLRLYGEEPYQSTRANGQTTDENTKSLRVIQFHHCHKLICITPIFFVISIRCP